MKKFICSMMAAIVFLLSPISAFASTTESMIMYAAVEDDYSVMPLSYSPSIPFSSSVGIYNKNDESFLYNTTDFGNFSNGDFLVSSDFSGLGYFHNYYNNISFFSSFAFGEPSRTSVLSIPDGSTLQINLNNILFEVQDASNNNEQYLLRTNLAVPFKCFAKMHFTAIQQIGYTHSETYLDQIVEISPFLQQSSTLSDDFYFDLDATINVKADTSNASEDIDMIYDINLRYIELFVVYDYSQFISTFDSGSLIHSFFGSNFLNALYFRYLPDSPISSNLILTYNNYGGSSDIVNSTTAIQSSISQVSSSLNGQINNVKMQVTQATNTISSRIQTMETNVVDGLNNVILSAQQNTQNIINTVTQKVDQVKETVTEVKDSILDLPNKIQEMLLGLIVPDSDTMADKYSEFSGLLEEKLGVIYQIPMMLFDFFDTIVNAATTPQTSLTLPAFTLPWIDGSTLTVWQPMEYRIIPEGMQVLSDLIKTITSMTVVVLTFNSVKRAYERFLRS